MRLPAATNGAARATCCINAPPTAGATGLLAYRAVFVYAAACVRSSGVTTAAR